MSFTLLHSADPVARKSYRCQWCFEGIHKGERHHYYVCVYYGDFSDNRIHRECAKAMDEFSKLEGGDVEFYPGEFKRGSIEQYTGPRRKCIGFCVYPGTYEGHDRICKLCHFFEPSQKTNTQQRGSSEEIG